MASSSERAIPMQEQHGDGSTVTVGGAPSPLDDDKTLVDENRLLKDDMVAIDDWSQTGRGSHADFKDDEVVPLQQENFLGRGAVGDVHEVTVQGYKLAHKKIIVKRKLGGREMKEIEILKRLSTHEHIIQLVGTYTHRQFLGLLMYPVAVCDLATFFDDVEAWHKTGMALRTHGDRVNLLEPNQKHRLLALGYDLSNKTYKASAVYSKIGCLISATAFLHDQKIRHKDLKPSNILLARDRMWLSDFGSATDFSLLSQSATDNERGTPRYFSPEVAAWQPNGRAADIFSLGCVLLEVFILHDQGTLQHMRQNRSADPSFHANTDRVMTWLQGPITTLSSQHAYAYQWSSRRKRLVDEITTMLNPDPARRPTAKQLLIRTTGYDLSHRIGSNHSIFGQCCRSEFVPTKEHAQKLAAHNAQVGALQSDLTKALDVSAKQQSAKIELQALVNDLRTKIDERLREFSVMNAAMRIAKDNQCDSELEYNRDREQWLHEKRRLEDRLTELEARAHVQEDRLAASRRSPALEAGEGSVAKGKNHLLHKLQKQLSVSEKSTEEKQGEINDLLMILGDMEEKRRKDKKCLRALGENVSDSDDLTDEEQQDNQVPTSPEVHPGTPERPWHLNFPEGATEQEIVRARQRQFMQQQFSAQQQQHAERAAQSPSPRVSSHSQPSFPLKVEARPSTSAVVISPRSRTGSHTNKPLPFVRPSDIYKRFEEPRERPGESLDSSRPSPDSLLRVPRKSDSYHSHVTTDVKDNSQDPGPSTDPIALPEVPATRVYQGYPDDGNTYKATRPSYLRRRELPEEVPSLYGAQDRVLQDDVLAFYDGYSPRADIKLNEQENTRPKSPGDTIRWARDESGVPPYSWERKKVEQKQGVIPSLKNLFKTK